VLKHPDFLYPRAHQGTHLPSIATIGEERRVKVRIAEARAPCMGTEDLLPVGEGRLRSRAVVGELLEDKLVLCVTEALMARSPLEAQEEGITKGNLSISFGEVQEGRLLDIKIGTCCMPV
jgi:hypothetical protein